MTKKNSPKPPDISQYDYRRNKCHLLLNNGLREAKLYEDRQSGTQSRVEGTVPDPLAKIFTPSPVVNENESSQVSVGEIEDDCIIEDEESTLNQ